MSLIFIIYFIKTESRFVDLDQRIRWITCTSRSVFPSSAWIREYLISGLCVVKEMETIECESVFSLF